MEAVATEEKRIHVLDLFEEQVLPALTDPKEIAWLRKLMSYLHIQGREQLDKDPPRFKREFKTASSRQRVEHKAHELVRFAERQNVPAAAFFLRPDVDGRAPVGTTNGDDEFIYHSVMTMVMNNQRVGLAVLRKMQADDMTAELIKKVLKENPELAAEVLARGKALGLERSDLNLSDLPKYSAGQYVNLLPPDEDAEGPFAVTMREFAGKVAQVKNCTSDYVMVEVQRKTGQTPDSMGVMQDAYEFVELLYPIDKVTRDEPETGEHTEGPIADAVPGAGGDADEGEGIGASADEALA